MTSNHPVPVREPNRVHRASFQIDLTLNPRWSTTTPHSLHHWRHVIRTGSQKYGLGYDLLATKNRNALLSDTSPRAYMSCARVQTFAFSVNCQERQKERRYIAYAWTPIASCLRDGHSSLSQTPTNRDAKMKSKPATGGPIARDDANVGTWAERRSTLIRRLPGIQGLAAMRYMAWPAWPRSRLTWHYFRLRA